MFQFSDRYNKILSDINWNTSTIDAAYNAQEKTPEGSSIGLFLTQSNLLNYKRNKLCNFDVYPSIGNLPETDKREDWEKWAQEKHIDFLLMDNFKKETYNANYIDGLLKEGVKNYVRVWAPKRKATIENLMKIKKEFPSKEYSYYVLVDLRSSNKIKEEQQ